MKATPSRPVEQLKAAHRFETLRKTLGLEHYADHLERPLAYWALPSDRRLPRALLGRTLGDLLATPFAELAATPGVGQKKIDSFVCLLTRVVDTDPGELAPLARGVDPALAAEGTPQADQKNAAPNGFDPASVSELVWAQWRGTIARCGLEDVPLGRVAPSLQGMTRASWTVPLGEYARRTLAEIRQMKTHGRKRIRAVLEVFYRLHRLLGGAGVPADLALRIQPARMAAIESWIGEVLTAASSPAEEEILARLIHPMLEQLRLDASAQIVSIAEFRLGLAGPVASVREAARSLGLTRARVYQLLDEMQDVFAVRWPAGRAMTRGLASHLGNAPGRTPTARWAQAAVEVFFPPVRRAAARFSAPDKSSSRA